MMHGQKNSKLPCTFNILCPFVAVAQRGLWPPAAWGF